MPTEGITARLAGLVRWLLAAGSIGAWAGGPGSASAAAAGRDGAAAARQAQLAEEVRGKGWLIFAARSDKGDWDLFACRPDGSDRRTITRTPEYNEAAPQLSRDGRRLLYRRLPRDETIDGNRYGAQGRLVLANSDGTAATAFGSAGEYPWASWSPDGTQIACLAKEGISLVDLASGRAVRRLPRKGFFQQLVWSPDGRWLGGVANSFGASWSIARMDAQTGAANAVSRDNCCTPDWFPDSRRMIFSNRPPGQKANNGYGWTQLWMADAEGRQRQLVFGEDGRHVYGGHISPDGKYVVFTGNVQENGDTGHAGAPMGLIRLADGPIIRGQYKELRALFPQAADGPVLALPVGWEPCWTHADIWAAGPAAAPATSLASAPATGPTGADGPVAAPAAGAAAPGTAPGDPRQDINRLAAEVRGRGWIVFSAATGRGDWDLCLMRPDGSDRRRLTDTADRNEAGARFSPDGTRLLYFRLPRGEAIDNNTYGLGELVISAADGGAAAVYGRGFDWACWGPDGSRLACLARDGIRIVDLASRQVISKSPRKGIVQQLSWSPDGNWFIGTANGLGVAWNIGRLGVQTGQINAVGEAERYNCTPDWLGDSRHVIYSRGIIPDTKGWAELWAADGEGRQRQVLYAEPGRHIYGGCASPDGRHVLFTRSESDLGRVDNSRTSISLIRRADTPMVVGDAETVRKAHPTARAGPRLDLAAGWEPHWTSREVGGDGGAASGSASRDGVPPGTGTASNLPAGQAGTRPSQSPSPGAFPEPGR